MKHPSPLSLGLLALACLTLSCATAQDDAQRYLGQTPPGTTPQVFAPGLISLETEYEFGSVFNRDHTEFYYGVDVGNTTEIRFSQYVEGAWTAPVTILSHEVYGYNDPFLSPDENRLYFISQRPLDGLGEPKDYDIWYVERQGEGWSEPINPGAPINTEYDEYYISFTQAGDLYFGSNRQGGHFDIYAATWAGGTFTTAERLSEAINSPHYEADVFVDPAERYLIFCAGRPEGRGRGDLYISFRQADGTWTEARNMGDAINTPGHELCPFVTADGKYFFYSSRQDLYWVSTEVLEALR